MTSHVLDRPAEPVSTAEPRVRFGDLVAAEWIKTRSLRSTWWSLGLVGSLVVLAAVNAGRVDAAFYSDRAPDPHVPRMYAVSDAFTQPGYLTLMLVAGTLGALAITSEYGTGSIRTTLVAVPARGQLLLAKAGVLVAVWTVAGALMSGTALWASQAILAGSHAGVSVGDPGVFRALVASSLLAPVSALVGLAFGVLVRHAGGSMVSTTFALLLLPLLFSRSHRWSADLMFSTVSGAWDRLSRTWVPEARPDFFVATVRGSWIVYGAWSVGAVLVAVLVARRRDV